VWAFVHIQKKVSVGTECNIGDHSFIENGAIIGNRVTIKNQALIWEGVTIEDEVFIGPRVTFTNDKFPRSPRCSFSSIQKRYSEKKNWLEKTVVKKGATLGAGVIILPGITVGEYAMVGAGSVVTQDVPSYTLVCGNPAKFVRKIIEDNLK
jgi:acetyltransferase-like isoleucine patch superfamily enzyme